MPTKHDHVATWSKVQACHAAQTGFSAVEVTRPSISTLRKRFAWTMAAPQSAARHCSQPVKVRIGAPRTRALWKLGETC
jgi:hypothetical protein